MTIVGSGGIEINRTQFTGRFKRDFQKLPPSLIGEVKDAIKALKQNPRPKWIRFEKLHGYRNPNIYTIHATRNHSHKISLEIADGAAILRRIATHKKIDTTP